MITIITKAYCPYCTGAKQFLESLGRDFEEIDVSHDREKYEQYQEIS
jgi:glutaredoxin